MRRSGAAIAAQPRFTERQVRAGRLTTNGSSRWLKRRQRNSIEPLRDALHPTTILNALEQTQAVVGIVDGRIIHWSRGAERLYGWTANEAIGCHAGDLLKRKDAGALKASAAELSSAGDLVREA